jgi:GT2 family glycosyltransferase
MRDDPKVIVVILNWNRKDVLIECIQSVLKMTYPHFDIVVVDNHSHDGSAEAVRKHFPDILVIENDKNYGAIEGKNIGLRRAVALNAQYIFALDNDLIADPACLTELVNVCETDPDVGVVAAKIYDLDRPDIILAAGTKIDYTQNIVRQYGKGEKDMGQYEVIAEVDAVGAGHMLVNKEVFEKVGYLDTLFLGYGYEDIDFGVQTRQAGFKVVYCPTAKVWHRPHSGIGHYSFRKKYLEARNAICFMKKHARWHHWVKYLFFVGLGLPYALVREGLRGNIGGVWGKARGLFDGLRGYDELTLQLMNPKK